MYGCTGVPCVKKLRKLKMKTRQYDTDEAGDYGDAVPVLLEILHNSGFGYKVKMAAPVFTEKCKCLQRNAESKNTTNKWVHGQVGSSSVYREMQSQRMQQTSGYMDFILL